MSDFKTSTELFGNIGKKKPLQNWEEKEKELKAKEAKIAKEKMIVYLHSISNVPTKYKDANLNAITQEQQKLVKKIRANFSGKSLAQIKNMLVFGSVGTGKTHIACGLINTLIQKGVLHSKYIREYDLLELYFRKEYQAFENFKKCKVLVIDELAKRPLEEWQKIHLEELLSYRYDEQLPTIFLTNATIEVVKEFIGARLYSRLKENITTVPINGDDLRVKKS